MSECRLAPGLLLLLPCRARRQQAVGTGSSVLRCRAGCLGAVGEDHAVTAPVLGGKSGIRSRRVSCTDTQATSQCVRSVLASTAEK